MGVATKKTITIANSLMMQKNTSPVFTGNIPCYLINQVFEYELGIKYVM